MTMSPHDVSHGHAGAFQSLESDRKVQRLTAARRLKGLLLAATACGSALAFAQPALAQDNQISELIVTARKRQESLMNAPVIAAAISQEQLERAQLKEVRDIARFVPGLNFAQGLGNSGVQPSLRGIGTTALDPSIDQTVSLNIDGMQFTQGLAYQSAMFDLGQVEVLKGPQALFFGKSSPGGVISIRTADPSDKFEVIARAGYEFEAYEKRGELIVSGPVTDTLKLRMAALYSDQQGFFSNPAIALLDTGALPPSRNRAFPAENFTIRATALWTPNDRFDARLKGTYTEDHIIQSGSGQYTFCPEGTAGTVVIPGLNGGAPIPFIGGGEDCKADRTIRVVDLNPSAFPGTWGDGVPFLDTIQKYSTLEMNYRLMPELTLTSQTGYYWIRSASMSNGGTSTFAAPAFAVQTAFRRREFHQEFRLNSEFQGPLNFTGGLFYEDGAFAFQSELTGNRLMGVPLYPSRWFYDVGIKTYSAYGQLRWQALPALEVAVGARYTDETRKQEVFNLIASNSPALREITPVDPKIGSKTWSPELTLTYRPSDTLTVFGALKQGYKSGSFNVGTTPSTTLSNAYDDEKVRGGEVGVKSRLFDRTLALELAYYNYKYTGLQVGTSEPAVGTSTPVARILNAGSARVEGVEFAAQYRPPQVEGLGLFLNANYNDGHFKELNNIPCWGGQLISEGCNQSLNPATGRFTAQDLSGLVLPRSPDWQVNFGFDYERPVAYGLTLVVSNSNYYSSEYLTTLGRREDFFQDGFIKSDLTLAVRGPEDRWEVALIGKNLGNRITTGLCTAYNATDSTLLGAARQITGSTTRGPSGSSETACRFDRGREIWLRLSFKPFN